MKADKMIWFENLKHHRKMRGKTLASLAKEVGITHAQMGVIERQESGTPKNRAIKIAKALRTTLPALKAYRRLYARARAVHT